jgi:hypothetical protein
MCCLYSINGQDPAAGIDEATPQGPKRLPALAGQSDLGSYCRARAGPFSAAAE